MVTRRGTAGHADESRALIAVEILVAVNATYGGIGLIRNGMGMPDEWLERTPFSSWLWPAYSCCW